MDNQLPIPVWLYISLVACTQTASVGELAIDGAADTGVVDAALPDAALVDTAIDRPLIDAPAPDSADPCAAACDQLGTCFGDASRLECMSLCAGDADMVLACDARRSACTYPPECTTTSSLQRGCEAQCMAIAAEECIAPFEERECIAACSDRTEARIMRFNACDSSTCETDYCFPILVPLEPDNVGDCRDGCDTMQTFDCIDAAELTLCRETCGRVTFDAAETFASCTRGICMDDSCLTQLLLADR